MAYGWQVGKGEYGITLIELLITMLIFSLLLTFAVPAFRATLMNNRITATTNQLFNSMQYARDTALNNNISVRVCPYNAAGSSTCGSAWSSGFIVVDTSSGRLLQTVPASTTDPTVAAVAINGVTPTTITFDSRGLATTSANFVICDSRGGNYARSLEVLPTGYVQIGNSMGQAVWNNGAISCP